MKKLLLSVLIFALGASAASAGPVLKSQIVVKTPIVTVGDMFDGADLYAEKALFRSPAPGTSGRVSLDAVRVAAAKIGLTDFRPPESGAVTVARFGRTVDETSLSGLIRDTLTKRGFLASDVSAEVSFSGPLPLMTADTDTDPVSLVTFSYLSGSGQFTARFDVSGQQAPVTVSGRVDLVVEVPYLANSLPGDAVIRPSDVEMRKVAVRTADTGSFSSLDQVIGMQLKRPARAGKMLKPGDLMEPRLVQRNQPVTIVYQSGPLTLTVKGQALGDAAEGESLQVLNLMSSKVLSAYASAPGKVVLVGSSANAPTTAIR